MLSTAKARELLPFLLVKCCFTSTSLQDHDCKRRPPIRPPRRAANVPLIIPFLLALFAVICCVIEDDVMVAPVSIFADPDAPIPIEAVCEFHGGLLSKHNNWALVPGARRAN